jgi:hypothetical protein
VKVKNIKGFENLKEILGEELGAELYRIVNEYERVDENLAICQMQTIKMIFAGGGLDETTALHQCDCFNKECLKLAEDEGLDKIADIIRQNI